MKQYLLYPYNDNFIESIDEQFEIYNSSDFHGEYPSFEASDDILEFDKFFGPQKILTENIELDTLITPAIWDWNNCFVIPRCRLCHPFLHAGHKKWTHTNASNIDWSTK